MCHTDSEGNEPGPFFVDNPVDSWSMEPIEDFIGDVSPNPRTNNIEWHNPFNSPGGTDLSADPNSPAVLLRSPILHTLELPESAVGLLQQPIPMLLI